MTFDDDFVRVHFPGGHRDITCNALCIDWPPPKKITVDGANYTRTNMSAISDSERERMFMVARGAEYNLVGGNAQ